MSVQMTIAQLRDLADSYNNDSLVVYVDLHIAGPFAEVAPLATGTSVAAETPAPTTSTLTADDFPVGTAIRWVGARFVGNGEVIKHNDDDSVSVRIFDERARANKRVNLNVDDIASGNLTRR